MSSDMKRTGRPRMTRDDYLVKYRQVIFELRYMEKSLRRIAKEQKVGLSTIMRLKKRFAL